ncbi:glycosyltransferase [Pararhodobacter sp. CCB-MM2]|uniref:glycosyltransferase n=1 Tax=Pararhodobacter sp. CCB-MM2 TaxID=1786003 RepID=UPI00082A7D26|nr:glycosyltransferase [Pararhodobacter sp. CCB-MM2]
MILSALRKYRGQHAHKHALQAAFDAPFYRQQSPELASLADAALLQHYLDKGWKAGLDPSAEFSTDFYLQTNPDVRAAGVSPLMHYLSSGRAEGRLPTQLAADCAQIRPVFDMAFYRTQSPVLDALDETELLKHYLTTGWKLGYDPSPGFSTSFYLQANGDVRALGVPPLLHYLRSGRDEGRLPTQLAADCAFIKPVFDAEFYRSQDPALSPLTEQELIQHYLTEGWRRDYDPSRDFSTRFYLSTNPDVQSAGGCPLLHYLRSGKAEGRLTAPWQRDAEYIRSGFDADFYRTQDPQLVALDVDALLRHYLTQGWQSGFDPNESFSSERYLKANPDVREDGKNPFLHYLLKGKFEGRAGRPYLPREDLLSPIRSRFDPAYYRAQSGARGDSETLLVHYASEGWRAGYDPERGFSVRSYLKANPDVRAAGIEPLGHYCEQGHLEGRPVFPAAPRCWDDLSSLHIQRLMTAFEPAWYLAQLDPSQAALSARLLPDPAAALAHYVRSGWQEDLDPSPEFSTSFYLQTYPDSAGCCPLVHFMLHDHLEPRRPRADAPLVLGHAAQASLPSFYDVAPLHPGLQVATRAGARAANGSLRLHWIIPDFTKGDRAALRVFRLISHLETRGHHSTLWIASPHWHHQPDAAYQDILRFFQCLKADVRFVSEGLESAEGDVLFATDWLTAQYAQQASGFTARFELVTDGDLRHTPREDLLVVRSDAIGRLLPALCESESLADLGGSVSGCRRLYIPLPHDPETYRERPEQEKAELASSRDKRLYRIVLDAHGEDRPPRALRALALLGAQRTDFEVHLIGSTTAIDRSYNFKAYQHEGLDEAARAGLYARCDLALEVEAALPLTDTFEKMASGLPLLVREGEAGREVLPDGVVAWCRDDPETTAQAIGKLLDAEETRREQALRARDLAGRFRWDETVEEFMRGIASTLPSSGLAVPQLSPPREILMDVVIPTRNGLGQIETVIAALRQQVLPGSLQIHCLDAASTDGTLEWLQTQPDIALTLLTEGELQNGRALNLGASQGQAPLIAFLAQDAVPVGRHWACDLWRMMSHYPQAAGVYGGQVTHPEDGAWMHLEAEENASRLAGLPLAVSRETDRERWERGDPDWLAFLYGYSQINCAVRREAWLETPFPELDYGADRAWANAIIAAGHVKLHAPTAVVTRSRARSLDEAYAEAKADADFCMTHLGYRLGPTNPAEQNTQRQDGLAKITAWGRRHHQPWDAIEHQHEILQRTLLGWHDGSVGAIARTRTL